MLPCQKDKFNIPPHITYLNCAYMGPTPKAAESAGVEALKQKSKPWEITVPDFFEPGKKARQLFAQLVNAESPERIAVIPSVSHGMASVVKNIEARPGQNIVMLEEQFPSNFYSWKRLADESGATIRIVSPPASMEKRGEKWNEELLKNIDSQTVVVTLSHVHWADGTLFDLVAIRKRSHEVGAKLIIDGTQSVGAYPFDVAAIQPDALICGAYKWLFGAYSSGLAYFGEAFDDGIPIEENWINRLGSENFQNLVNYQPEYEPGAQRYNMGEKSQFIALPILNESLRLILDWTPEEVQKYCGHISQSCLKNLREMGFWIEEPRWRGNHLIGMRMPEKLDLELLKKKASEENILVSFRGNAMRVAPHVYNDEEDFEKLEKLIRSII